MTASSHPNPRQKAPTELSSLFLLLKDHFQTLDQFLSDQVLAFEPEIRDIAAYCLENGGKRIRSALVFFSGWEEGPLSPGLVRLAAVIEMVHLATLVHDDIMDKADLRRNRATVAKKFGPDTAVLLGDALFSQAVHLATDFPSNEVCRYVSKSTRRVCSGEIMQTLRDKELNSNIESYRRIIDLKTAELFFVSCYLGARLTPFPSEYADAAGSFGRHLGTAYQMYDDLTDFFGNEEIIGKTLGTDLVSGKQTLPLLMFTERVGSEKSEQARRNILNGEPDAIQQIAHQMTDLGIFEEMARITEKEIFLATEALSPFKDLPPSTQLLKIADILRNQIKALKSE
ncbi:MAG: polyprenyl synthetase family protein [Opitutaceae bacterium]|nr:polyprenyl synthetase family protein [Opitutaceae bacterium]